MPFILECGPCHNSLQCLLFIRSVKQHSRKSPAGRSHFTQSKKGRTVSQVRSMSTWVSITEFLHMQFVLHFLCGEGKRGTEANMPSKGRVNLPLISHSEDVMETACGRSLWTEKRATQSPVLSGSMHPEKTTRNTAWQFICLWPTLGK